MYHVRSQLLIFMDDFQLELAWFWHLLQTLLRPCTPTSQPWRPLTPTLPWLPPLPLAVRARMQTGWRGSASALRARPAVGAVGEDHLVPGVAVSTKKVTGAGQHRQWRAGAGFVVDVAGFCNIRIATLWRPRPRAVLH